MFPLPFSESRLQMGRAALLLMATAACLFLTSGKAQAQAQENGLLSRIDHPDRNLAFPLSSKQFGATAAFKDKTANVKSFGFGKTANFAGDGSFHTQSFVSSTYKSKGFNLRDGASPGAKSFGQTNKLFDTKSVDVRDARDANKTLAVHAYDSHDPFIVHGKRQDTYDEMLKRNKLTIEEVRELLNKNK